VKKPFLRRLAEDHSQRIRAWVQWSFLALNVWIGVQFWLFVRHYETAGATVLVSRPAGVEGWLPIAALMNWKYFFETGSLPRIHGAGMFLLGAFFLISILLRKSFCGWLCPVGTLSETLWKAGRWALGRNFAPPRWLDIPLRSLKYVLLGLFLYAVGSMSAPAIRTFLEGPYGLVADVKMLNFFRHMTITVAVVTGLLAVASLFIPNFWCRYLCPYGALMGLGALLSPLRIRRSPERCIDCAKCAKECPSLLPVDRLVQIRSAECLGCMRCVAVCPAEEALVLGAPRRRKIPATALAAAMLAIFMGTYVWANAAGRWKTELPPQMYYNLIPRAHEFGHP
jgi:polyferredoxin